MGNPTDPPPSYDQATASSSCPSREPTPQHTYPEHSRSSFADSPIPDATPYHSLRYSPQNPAVVTHSPALSQDPCTLHDLVATQAHQLPRPYLQVMGWHREVYQSSDNRENRTHSVIDFDFGIDLTPYVFARDGCDDQWQHFHVVRDDDGELAFRGGRIRSRTGCALKRDNKKKRHNDPVEDGRGEDSVGLVAEDDDLSGPDLMGWCERYCSDPAGVKSFRFNRRIVGLDISVIRSVLTTHIRSLNYRGSINITTGLTNGSFVVYSPHWVNKLRNTRYVYYFCVILQLWLITWPIIWLLERRYEVVESRWLFAHDDGSQRQCISGRDEEHIARELAPVVRQAAWERRQQDGQMLSRRDMDLMRRLARGRQGHDGHMDVVHWDQISGWGADDRDV